MINTLAIIGAGRVGRALGKRLRIAGWRIGPVVARSQDSARRAVRLIGGGRACVGLTGDCFSARVILLAVPDDAIASVVKQFLSLLDPHAAGQLRGKVFLHTCGALDAQVLQPLSRYGAAIGSLHPLQSFSGVSVPSLEGKCFAVEGDAIALQTVRRIVRDLGGRAIRIAAGKKSLYHGAAALAAGHVLAVEEAAARMMTSAGMSRREATRALLSLTRQVLDNFERLGPRSAWTGPLSRGDYRVIARHKEGLSDWPAEYVGAYDALNRLAARLLAGNTKSTLARLDELERSE